MHPGTRTFVTAAVVTSLAALLIIFRISSRIFLVKQAGVEDYLILLAFGFSVALTVVIGLEVQHGFGDHAADLKPGEFVAIFKLLYVSIIMYNLGLLSLKTSILFQYQRFFVDRMYRNLAWGLMALVLVAAFNWDKSIDGGYCINQPPVWYTIAGFTIATDIAVLLLPMPVLKSLHLPKRQKYSLMATFALGGFGCITAILRLQSLIASSTSKDITYDGPPAHAWSSAELNIGIICASIPALRPLFGLVFPHFLSTNGPEYLSNPYPRAAGYYRNDSTVELSRVSKSRCEVRASGAPQDDNASAETDDESRAIHVKQNWTITEEEKAD